MATFSVNLLRHEISADKTLSICVGHHVLFVVRGAVSIEDQRLRSGEGIYIGGGKIRADANAELLEFQVTEMARPEAILSEAFEWSEPEAVLRLDQVSFPPGACAYRHTHPGPGIRCLIEGSLQIQSDHHTEEMKLMSAWFEDAGSPVKATAGDTATSFVRAMVLPQDYIGKSTLNILDPEDAAKPMLQTNRRIVDQIIHLSSA